MDNKVPLFDNIDVENLFQSWHRDVKSFTKDLDQNSVLTTIKNTEVSLFDISEYDKVLNFTNTSKCIDVLNRILKVKDVDRFIELLEERDSFHPRHIEREYSPKQILKSVQENNYHPILFLELNNKYYIIDGRTRFYCCIFLNLPAKVRIISENTLK